MSYPGMTDYQDVLQDPTKAFTDPLLQRARVVTSPLGLPVPMSGGFAITYRLESGGSSYAVRCFHREIPGVNQRYALISKALSGLPHSYFAAFDFQPSGILVNGSRYPIVKMDWMQGQTLDAYLERHATDRGRMTDLRARFGKLASWLQTHGIAHGDLQNGNVVVEPSELRLIDYDGMFVPGMSTGSGSEVGHKHFQHPGRTVRDFGPQMDRFSFIVLDLSLEALAVDPTLHRRFREGGEAIVLKANDFADPDSSEAFRALRAIPSLKERADRLAAICSAPIQSVPSLEDYQTGRNIPTPPLKTSSSAARQKAARHYIGAYPVVDGSDYEGVLRQVGDRVEIVGKVVSVKRGVGRRGRGRGRPYVFINFGIWNQKSVKVTIWSEGLSAMNSPPDETWVGRWLSVTGLVEPPYEGAHYGKPYFSVGVTLTSDSQLVQLDATEAKFRLGEVGKSVRTAKPSAASNTELVDALNGTGRGGTRAAQQPSSIRTPSPHPPTANAALLATLQPTGNSAAGTSVRAGTPPTAAKSTVPKPPASKARGEHNWIGWLVAIGIILFLLSRCGA